MPLDIMKRILVTAIACVCLAYGADSANAQNSVGVNVGYNLDADELFLGGQLRLAPASLPVIINPSLETYFVDGTWLRIDVNALYPFGVQNTTFTPYAGGGLGLNYINPENGDSDTDALLNFVFGATFGFSRIQPFAEARVDISNDVGASLRGGILIGI